MKTKTRNKWPVVLLGIGVLAVILLLLELTNTTHVFHKAGPASNVSAGQDTKGEPATSGAGSNAATGGQSDTTGPQPGDTKANGSSANLIAPSGNFVSAHSNVPLNSALSSVCNTTAGAQCDISFTSGGVTKSLGQQTTDRGGATYWNSWTPASIGLTPGTWKVQATASLNGQSKSSVDAMDLVVTQ